MKPLLRLIFKILATPIAVPGILVMILIGYGNIFVNWLWESQDELDCRITRELKDEFTQMLKRWFTTI